MSKISLFLICSIIFVHSKFLSQTNSYNDLGLIIKYESNFAPFPHKARAVGHNYGGNFYNANDHYSDSTVLIFMPDHMVNRDTFDLVFYFHGWRNNIDTSLSRFQIIEQFYESGKKGILVFPESAKNAPDSFGGKLEEKGIFKELVAEIVERLKSDLRKDISFNNITLAGHSGAYRVMSFILLHGGLTDKIESVYLFDGLYGGLEKFGHWIENYSGSFINIYTPNGGTVGQSENLMISLKGWNIPFIFLESDEFSSNDLKKSRIIFIKSNLGHSDVIHTKRQFRKFLESSL